MNKERPSFSKYGKAFQESLCQLILQDRPFCDQISEVLDIQFLELKYLQVFTSKIFGYRKKYGSHPSYNTLVSILKSGMDGESEALQTQVRSYFARIQTSDFVDGAEYIKETALDFCKKQKLKEAMIKSSHLLQTSSFDEISKLIFDALKLGLDNNVGHDYLKDFEERFKPRFRNPISTGWKEVDKIVKGGLGQGELGVVIAPTGAGKSMALVHLGSRAILLNKSVVHYTLELQDKVVASRYDSCITNVPLSDLGIFKEEIFEKVKNLKGKLIVKEYPTKSASVSTIKNHLDKLQRLGNSIDMVIVDYGDLLRPTVVRKEKRYELETIYEELRALAQEYKCPVWTASQTNRSGLNAEVITMEAISEAFNKCFVADFIFSISRTVEDKVSNSGRMFVAKNRNGPDGLIYPIFMDTSKVKIEVMPQTNETVEQIVAASAKEQAENLKKKYADFNKNKKKES